MSNKREDEDTMPTLISRKPMKDNFSHLQEININSDNFTMGRGLRNSVTIPFISISRNHCILKKSENNEWMIEDCSTLGITLNGESLGKGISKPLSHGDIIVLEPTEEFAYDFHYLDNDIFEIPKKRIKLEKPESCTIDNVKMKFEQSQNIEIKHIEDKIQSAKNLQNASIVLKKQLQLDMNRKIQTLQSDFAQQIENLKGAKNEVEKQKAMLIEERDEQLAQVKNNMEGKISELMEQIQKHNETESELLNENNVLREKLTKEREEFLSELTRESTSKQAMLDKLNAKIREQEEVRLKEKQDLEMILKKETDQLRWAMEKELKDLEDQKRQRELELELELSNIKKNLTEQMQITEQQKLKAEEQLNLQMEEMKKLSCEDKIKMEQLFKEREEIQNQLKIAQENSEKSLADLQKRVSDREIELAALAATRIQQHTEQSSEVISTLQDQLEKMKNQLQSVETEKNCLLESIVSENPSQGTSKQSTLSEVGELMENELQCSICAELFIEATTLNCSHTFCKYCITMWKKKKKDCPICRASITAENRSLVLDTFIEKMVQNLTEEMKIKRKDVLTYRAELVSEAARQTAGTSRTSFPFGESESEISDDEFLEEEEENDESPLWSGALLMMRRTRQLPDTSGTLITSNRTTVITSTLRTNTTSSIPVVDLTTPISGNPGERPPMLPPPDRQRILPVQHLQQMHGIIHAHQVIMPRGAVVRTTEATGGAFVASRTATGLPAVPSDNQSPMPMPFIVIDDNPQTGHGN